MRVSHLLLPASLMAAMAIHSADACGAESARLIWNRPQPATSTSPDPEEIEEPEQESGRRELLRWLLEQEGEDISISEIERFMTRRDSARLASSMAEVSRDEVVERYYGHTYPATGSPLVFKGLRYLPLRVVELPEYKFRMNAKAGAYDTDRFAGILYSEPLDATLLEEGDELLSISPADTIAEAALAHRSAVRPDEEMAEPPAFNVKPGWLRVMQEDYRMRGDMEYRYMMQYPERISYAYWQLPVPPKLADDDMSLQAMLMRQNLPMIKADEAMLPDTEQRRVHWLHTFNTGLQFSQAYISHNWYQGGNDYLALLFNFNWDVALNTVFHPDLLFTSNLVYKLAVNSNSSDALHKYSISQDPLQYNLKMGVKAFKKWFYSFTLQFKTQFFNAFPADSYVMSSSFLSPADLNMGLGMTYNLSKRHDTLKFSASIAPISYNLKACMNTRRVDPTQFNIEAGRHTRSEFGSNAELTLNWDITSNISWKSRVFLFTDYHYFQADWENTFNFNITRFLSTQLYLHPRYDSSGDFAASKWHYWMLKEILSFGLSYTFSTKP